MKLRLRYACLVLPLLALGACNTLPAQPEIARAAIEPANLEPGKSAIITVAVLDRNARVKRVEGVVKEDPTITLVLHDDGVDPDRAADDGIWTLKVDVPFNAPPGEFELQISALDERGGPVLITDERGEVSPLGASLGLVIRYPGR